MTFVHPLLLGGLVLIGVPILLHLIMRQKPKHLLFPALRFLVQKYRLNQRKLQLRHLLLLLLRILLIAAICLALARPKIFSERINFGGGQPVAAVLVIDTSMSMEYATGGKTRLDEAKQRALELLDELPEGSRVAVIDTAESISRQPLGSAALAREKVAGLQLRPGNGPVTRQIEQGYRMLESVEPEGGEGAEPMPRFLYVFSDRTEESWELNRLKDLQELRDRLQPKANAVFVDVGVNEPVDYAIVDLKLRRQSIPANQPVTIDVTVRATGKNYDGAVVCRIDGKEPDKKAVVLQAGQSQVITFQRGGFRQGVHQVELTLEPADAALPFNNMRFATFEVRGPRQVLILTDDPKDADHLKPALTTESLPGGAFRCIVKSTKDAAELTISDGTDPENSLASYQAVCLLNVAWPDRNELWQKLAKYVQKGGGLAVMLGNRSEPSAYNDAKAAKELLPGNLGKIVEADNDAGVAWETSSYQHPVIAVFKESAIDLVKTFRYWELAPLAPEYVIVRYADKTKQPALLERHFNPEKMRGRVLLFTTALDSPSTSATSRARWNNYITPGWFYMILTDKAVGYLAGNTEDATLNFSCGQTVPVALPNPGAPQSYTLQGGGLGGSDALVAHDGKANPLLISQAEAAGNYTLVDPRGNTVAGFSLNVPPGESDLKRLDVKKVEELFGPDSVLPLGPKVSLSQALQSRWSQPYELFPWLMILVLLILAVENLLANKFYRREPTPTEEQQS